MQFIPFEHNIYRIRMLVIKDFLRYYSASQEFFLGVIFPFSTFFCYFPLEVIKKNCIFAIDIYIVEPFM